MERSEIRDPPSFTPIPDYAALHPGYYWGTCPNCLRPPSPASHSLSLRLIAGMALFASVIGGVSGYGTGALMPLVLVPIFGRRAGGADPRRSRRCSTMLSRVDGSTGIWSTCAAR